MPEHQNDTGEIDEALAWALVCSARTSTFDGIELARSVRAAHSEIAIEISATGGWNAWLPVSPAAAQILDIYLPYVAGGGSCTVLAQIGQSLDGHIATRAGQSRYVTGQAGLLHLHRLRALSDVVIVGAGTVIADNPRLTVRKVDGSNPARAVVDPNGRVPHDRRLYNDGVAPTLVLTTKTSADVAKWPHGTPVIALPDSDGTLSPDTIVGALSSRGLRNILVEGGGITVSRFLQAGALDRLHVCVAPLIIGSGFPGLSLPPITELSDALRFPCRHHSLGDDVLFDLTMG